MLQNKIKQHFNFFKFVIALLAITSSSLIIYIHAVFFTFIRSEGTIIEFSQDLLLVLMISLAFISAYKQPVWRELLVIIGSVGLLMLIREQNNWFKSEVFRGAWELVALLVILPLGCFLFKNRKLMWQQFSKMEQLPGIPVGILGLIILLVFSRLVGKKELWQGLMGEKYMYSVKMSMEEGLELLGYSMMTAGVVILITAIFIGKLNTFDGD